MTSASPLYKLLVLCTILVSAPWRGHAQDNIGGIVNTYTPVRSITTARCQTEIGVASNQSFAEGDLILVIQMKGATQGTTYDVAQVGTFEFAVVASTSGGTIITTKRPLLYSYNVRGAVQCVRVPVYGNVTVAFPLQGLPWDGSIGGVIAIDVRGTLTLSAPIDANGIGFRGGATWNGNGTCSTRVQDDRANSSTAAAKGESYVFPVNTSVAGMAALFTGGGGGCAHNSGGAGGGSGGNGGNGGSQWEGCGRFFDNGGRGGLAYPNFTATNARAIAGGGGGAGHMNDNAGTGGAAGGGIIVIRAATIDGRGQRIRANGATPQRASSNDAAGGGGAGGTVVIETTSLLGGAFIEANGGAGGDVRTTAMHGPGGGGAGGFFVFSEVAPLAGMAFSLNGAANGRNVNRAVVVEQNYLATRGADGNSRFRTPIPMADQTNPIVEVTAPADTIVCLGTDLTLRAAARGRYNSIRWIDGSGVVRGTSLSLQIRADTTQVFTVVVEDSNGCSATDSVQVGIGNGWVISFPIVDRPAGLCADEVDDALWLYNSSKLPATVARVTSSSPGVVLDFPTSQVVLPGERLRIPVRITLPVNGALITSTIEATIQPCDTVVTTEVTVRRTVRDFGVTPDTILLTPVVACRSITVDTIIEVAFTDGACDVLDILIDGPLRVNFTTSWRAWVNVPYRIPVSWSPTRPGMQEARVGFIVREGACTDTVWVTVRGMVYIPSLNTSDTVQIPTLILCSQNSYDTTFLISAQDTSDWQVIDVTTTGPVTCSLQPGTIVSGLTDVPVSVRPTTVGPYRGTVNIRLAPCDTIVSIVIEGTATNVAFIGDQELVYTEPVIGRVQRLVASYRNVGTAAVMITEVVPPDQPFSIVQMSGQLPYELLPGGRFDVDVEILQTHGDHLDSLVVISSSPCMVRNVTRLSGSATAATVVAVPDVIGMISVPTVVPVLLVSKPQIDDSLLQGYTVSVYWNSTVASVESGSNSKAQWEVVKNGDEVLVRINGTWDGTDTLAVIPVTPLLSPLLSTPIEFTRVPGFVWTGQTSDVAYDDGSLTIDDPCAGRAVRSVRFSGAGAIALSPSPAQEYVEVMVTGRNQSDVVVALVSTSGEYITTTRFTAEQQIRLDLGSVASGVYLVQVQIGNARRDAVLHVIH